MRNLKRFLALVLAMMMVMSLMLTVNAKNVEFSDDETITEVFKEDLTVLAGMKVVKGYAGNNEDGQYKPQGDITRAEMAAIVYRLATGDVDDKQTDAYVGASNFLDVKDDAWYAGYVNYCENSRYIAGDGKGYFRPTDKVTGYEALAMLLRAMGYNEPDHDFTGSNWATTVLMTARPNGMLAKVDKTSYASRLSLPATRELVAELAFQTAIRPQVQWTLAFGYQDSPASGVIGNTSGKYPSLGEANFGLTQHFGIVLGNEATGEKATKIGFAVNPTAQEITDVIDADAYVYISTANNATLAFTGDPGKTGLDKFGHKVEVWYDNRGDGKTTVTAGAVVFNDNLPTYAIFDRVGKTTVVTSPTLDLTAAADTDPSDGITNIGEAVAGAGLKICSDTKTYWNYSFARMASTDRTDGTTIAVASPIKVNNTNTAKPYYLLISNNTEAANSLDMVVTLDLTVTQISQVNNNVKPTSVAVNVGDTGTAADIYFGGSHADERKVISGNSNRVNLSQAALTSGSDMTLGDNVVAIEITGTTGAANNGTAGNLPATSNLTANTSTFYYNLAKLGSDEKHIKVGNVVKVDTATNKVWLADGTELSRSWLADTVANNRDLSLNVANNVARTVAPTTTGEYTFTLDDDGNYIFWDKKDAETKFVYGTYLDWESLTASSKFRYPLVGVGMDGGRTVDDVITNENGTTLDVEQYVASEFPRRDANATTALPGSSLEVGKYIGVIMDAKGRLTKVTGTSGAVKQGDGTYFGAAAITINATSLKLGAQLAGKDGNNTGLYLTEDTQFYIVDGAGTDTQVIKSFKGLTDLMNGMTSVVIDAKTALAAGDYLAAHAQPYEMVYYTSSPFNHAQDYATTAYQVDTVFIPAECVTFNEKFDSNLFFVGGNASTLVDAGRDATQFTMYDSTGAERSIWLEGMNDGASNNYANSADAILDILRDADGNGTADDKGGNFFVSLRPTDDKAADGQPIYKIMPVAATASDAEGKVVGQVLTVFTAGTTFTLADANKDTSYDYKAITTNVKLASIGDTRTKLYDVSGAKVVNLNEKTYPNVADVATLNLASSVETNTGVSVSCVLNAEKTAAVDVIFVNAPTT